MTVELMPSPDDMHANRGRAWPVPRTLLEYRLHFEAFEASE